MKSRNEWRARITIAMMKLDGDCVKVANEKAFENELSA